MELTVVVQNLGHGGLRNGSGDPEDRWPLLAERIRSAGPADLVLVQEAVDWDRYGHRQLGRAMRDLDMDATPLPPSSSGYRPALLYRKETVGRWLHWNPDFSHKTTHGFGVAVFDVGLPAPLSVVSVHLDPHDADIARSEAKYVATRGYRYGPYALIAGDINYPPASPDHPQPAYEEMRPYNRAARTRLPSEVDGRLVPERRVAEKLEQSGYVDAAWHLFQESGDKQLLARTGTDDRIDQAWVSTPLRDTITEYRLLDSPAGASDHKGFVLRLDLSKAATDDVWAYR
ncbi:endonuclease/exonuclease/phosphatase family protein [Streptomyces sp. NPDC001407]|uniref:endonuclease/exonuclease/phosphatase family protein n=1 Tax=Streptomyces sp. NPDC001407 TaxID=3364573 RepID=UPI00367E614D